MKIASLKYLELTCGVIIMFVFVYVVISYNNLYEQEKQHSLDLEKFSSAQEKAEMSMTLMLDNLSMVYDYDNMIVPNIKIEDIHNNQKELRDLLYENDFKLVFFFSYLHCETCIENALNNIVSVSKDIKAENILIIGEFANLRAMKAFINNHPIDIPLYFKKDSIKLNILEEENMPFLCMMNKKLEIRHILIPIKEIPKQTKRYLECMKGRYFIAN